MAWVGSIPTRLRQFFKAEVKRQKVKRSLPAKREQIS
jgi:hypothetical protein